MAKKEKQQITFGTLPRDGYVYSLYRGHILRLGIVVAALTAILIWSVSGSWCTLHSYLFPSGAADLKAISNTTILQVDENPHGKAFYSDRIDADGVWVQNNCYRLEFVLDSVEEKIWTLDDISVYLCWADDIQILVVDDTMPLTGTPYQAVFTAVPDQLSYDLQNVVDIYSLPGYLVDLRSLPVGYEGADSLQLLLFAPVVFALLVYWILLLAKPQRHPIYRQLGRYESRVDAIVASIDQEVAAGQILEETPKSLRTTNWYLQRTAFMTTIYKNT